MIKRRDFFKYVGTAGLSLSLPWGRGGVLAPPASAQLTQTPISGKSIPKFVDPLPVFGSSEGLVPGQVNAPRVPGPTLTVSMHEVQQRILPSSFYDALAEDYQAGTWVWAYKVGGLGPLYPGVSIEAQRGRATTVTYENLLPVSGSHVQQYITVDQTIHWADPLGEMLKWMNNGEAPPYVGPPPVVPHLHGGEVPSQFDGGPLAWFTPGSNPVLGKGFTSNPYVYPNEQEAATLWFHDHALGATRLNVYAGLAAFYLLRDQYDTGLPDNPLGLPAGPYEREIAIQDRQFDTNGQWYFPDGSGPGFNGPPPNPTIHPFWNPEFFGDVMVVNGKSWPYLNVEPRRYRFRLLDGCNARFLELRLQNRATKTAGPAIWVIGTDGGLLDKPVKLNDPQVPANKAPRLLLAPGERFDVIIDFAGYAGQTLTLMNSAKGPYPNGMSADPQTTGQIMQFRVGKKVTGGSDPSYNPASGQPLRKSGSMPVIIRLADPSKGTPAANVTPTVKRQLTLVEFEGPGGPIEVLVNNTSWDGQQDDPDKHPIADSVKDSMGNYETEMPQVGATEQWEIINMTADAHPIHLHLTQFQLMNRQMFNVTQYRALYDSLFPGGYFGAVQADGTWGKSTYPAGVFIPAYGPPNPYNTPNADGAIGGNPAVSPFLQSGIRLPNPEEAGWKDTVKMYPGEVTRVLVRFAPQDTAIADVSAGTNAYGFDPTTGPGYVWHCHIVDHEDNEMMRPYHPVL